MAGVLYLYPDGNFQYRQVVASRLLSTEGLMHGLRSRELRLGPENIKLWVQAVEARHLLGGLSTLDLDVSSLALRDEQSRTQQ